MLYGKWAPIGALAGAFPRAIGPGFATFPGLGATIGGAAQYAIPVSGLGVAPGLW